MPKAQRHLPIGRLTFLFFLFIALFLAGEFALRRHSAHIVREDIDSRGSILESSPEFLVDYSDGKRRFVPEAKVLIRNHFLTGRDIPIRINRLGFRGRELAQEKPERGKRVLVLGDSITVNDGLLEEEGYVFQTEKRLCELGIPSLEFVNAGIGNVGLEEEREILEEKGLGLSPDIVVVGLYLNDSRPPWGFSGEIGNRGYLRRQSLLLESLYRVFVQYQFLSRHTEHLEWVKLQDSLQWKDNPEDFQQLVSAARFDWGALWETEEQSRIFAHLQALQALAKKQGFRLFVLLFPVRFQVEAEFLDASPQNAVKEFLEEQSIASLDLLPLFRAAREQELFLDHCHLSIDGNALVAQALSEALLPLLRDAERENS